MRTAVTRPPTSDPTLTVRASSVPERSSGFGTRFSRMYNSVPRTAAAITISSRRRLRRLCFVATTGTSNDTCRPEIDQSIDVLGQRERGCNDVEHLMKEDVRLQGTHEQQRGAAGVADAQNAGIRGALKVIADGGQGPARRAALVPWIERQDD